MLFVYAIVCRSFNAHSIVLFVLVAGTPMLLTRQSPHARIGGVLFIGLLAFLVPCLVVSGVMAGQMMQLGPAMPGDAMDWEFASNIWDASYWLVEVVAIILMSRVLRNAARDVQPLDCAGPLESGDPLEVTMSKKNHSPGPVPPGNRAGGTDQGSPDTGVEHAPPQDGTGFAEEDPQRRLGSFTGKGEHSIQQPTPRQDGDAKAK